MNTKSLQAAILRNDHVLRRLDALQEDEKFFYHVTNECYKKYMYLLRKELEERGADITLPEGSVGFQQHAQEPESSQTRRSMRSSDISSRNPASQFTLCPQL